MARNLDRGVESGRGGIQLAQLQLDALADRACTDARRIQCLHAAHQHRFHLGGVAFDFRPQRVGDLVQRFGQVAVVADGIDDGARNRELARFELGQLQLPQQVVLQRLAGGISEFLLALVIVVVPRGFRGADTLFAPALVDHLDGVVFLAALRRFGLLALANPIEVVLLVGRDRGVTVSGFERPGALGILRGLEHHICFEQLANVSLKFEGGELQEPDRLLQLRGHGQLLTQLELQRGFQHGDTADRVGIPIVSN
jgi:hypothetical protein